MGNRVTTGIVSVALAAVVGCGGGTQGRPGDRPPASRTAVVPLAPPPLPPVDENPSPEVTAPVVEVPERVAPDPSFVPATGVLTDTTGVLLPRVFEPAGPRLVDRYYLYLPRGVEARSDWPLVLWLHGRSLRGDDLARLKRYGIPARLAREDDFPFVVVAPQLPSGQSWTDTDRLAALVREVAGRYPVDEDRIYLVGYSLGAGGVWRLAEDHPELFAAVAPAAAYAPPPTESIARALAGVPVRIDHGTADEAAPIGRVRTIVSFLEAAGVDVTFEVYPGANHGALTRIYKTNDFFTWLLRHERDRTR